MAVPVKDESGKFVKGRFSKKQFSVRLRASDEEKFRKIAEECDRLPAELIREILEEWLSKIPD